MRILWLFCGRVSVHQSLGSGLVVKRRRGPGRTSYGSVTLVLLGLLVGRHFELDRLMSLHDSNVGVTAK
jgi:hypothetical protein